MGNCTDCGDRCGENPLVLDYGGENFRFCSWECLITYSAATLRRRIARRNRRALEYAQVQARCMGIHGRRASKLGPR